MSGSGTGCLHMSAAEYAAHRKCSDSYVRRLRRNGLIIDCAHGKIDVAASDQSLADNLHPIRGGDRTPAPPADQAQALPPNESAPGTSPPAAGAASVPGSSLPEAVRRERLARARLAELELGELSGQLIRRQDAMRATVTLVRQAVSRMRLMGSRLRGALAAASDPRKCESLIDAEIEEICADMRKAAELVAAGEKIAAELEQAAA